MGKIEQDINFRDLREGTVKDCVPLDRLIRSGKNSGSEED